MCARAGVRKHARKTHLAWLRSVDDGASTRDTRFESKPSTYCIKEEGYGEEGDYDVEEPSPTLTPTMSGLHLRSPGQSGKSSPTEMLLPVPLELPEPAMTAAPGSSAAARDAMVAATAALVGGAAQPPLAWLLAQNAMALSQNAMAQQALSAHAAHATAGSDPPQGSHHVKLPVSLGGSAPLPPWLQGLQDPEAILPPPVLGGADPRLAFEPLPAAAEWSQIAPPLGAPPPVGDLSSLFGPPTARPPTAAAAAQADYGLRGEDEGHQRDPLNPLCLTPPNPSVISPHCVSPFELSMEKRPFPMQKEGEGPPSAAAFGMPAAFGGIAGGIAAQMVAAEQAAKAAAMMAAKEEQLRLALSPTSTTFPFSDEDICVDDSLPTMKEAEYTAFVETLLL